LLAVLPKTLSAIAALSLVFMASDNVAIAATGDGDLSVYYIGNDFQGQPFAVQGALAAGNVDQSATKSRQENFLTADYAEAITVFDRKWGDLPQTQLLYLRPLKEGASGQDVALLRERLGLPTGDIYDAALSEKIFAFRRDHDLASGFTFDKNILIALNKGITGANYQLICNAPANCLVIWASASYWSMLLSSAFICMKVTAL
jgi:hypothetical protein